VTGCWKSRSQRSDGADLRESGRPNGNPDPLAAAKDIRDTFGRMAMNDEETVALIAGGHTFGKAHGAHKPTTAWVPSPPPQASSSKASAGEQVRHRQCRRHGHEWPGRRLECQPIAWSTQYLDNLFNFEWVQTKSPAGAVQWVPPTVKGQPRAGRSRSVEAARAVMFTTDLSLKFDPSYREIAKRFQENPEEFRLPSPRRGSS